MKTTVGSKNISRTAKPAMFRRQSSCRMTWKKNFAPANWPNLRMIRDSSSRSPTGKWRLRNTMKSIFIELWIACYYRITTSEP